MCPPIKSPAPVELNAPDMANAPTISSSILTGRDAVASLGFRTPHKTIASAPITVISQFCIPICLAHIRATASAEKMKIPAYS